MDAAQQFWEKYLETLPIDHPHRRIQEAVNRFGFGDSAEMADELGQLVYEGVKTATASLEWEYALDHEPIPAVRGCVDCAQWQR
jgi:uncharacterized protein YhfF